MVLELGHLGKQIRNNWQVLQSGAGEGLSRSAGPIVWEMRKCDTGSSRTAVPPHVRETRQTDRIGHILRRHCLLIHVIGGKEEWRLEVNGRRGRRRKQLLDDLQEKRGYWKLQEEALDRTVWRNGFGTGCGPFVRQIAKRTIHASSENKGRRLTILNYS